MLVSGIRNMHVCAVVVAVCLVLISLHCFILLLTDFFYEPMCVSVQSSICIKVNKDMCLMILLKLGKNIL